MCHRGKQVCARPVVAWRLLPHGHPWLPLTPALGILLATMMTTCEQQLKTQSVAEETLPESERLLIR